MDEERERKALISRWGHQFCVCSIQLQIGVGVGFDEWDSNWCVGQHNLPISH